MKTYNRKTSFYLMTLTAFVAVIATGFLVLTGFSGTSKVSAAQANDKAPEYALTREMIIYALTHKADDLNTHYQIMNQLPCTELASTELGGRTLKPGVYCLSSATIGGDLILDGEGDAASVFIFRVAGSLSAKSGASIQAINGAMNANVHFVADSVKLSANTQLEANILANRAIDAEDGVSVKGSMQVVSGALRAAEGTQAPQATGYIEICKRVTTDAPTATSFNFTVTGRVSGSGNINVPVGSCSGPIEVNTGLQTITEVNAANGTNNFVLDSVVPRTTTASSTLGEVNLAAGTAVVNVGMGTVNNELVLDFFNRRAITGFVEICKAAATLPGGGTDPDVTGMFTYTIAGVYSSNIQGQTPVLQQFVASVGQCTGAIRVLVAGGNPPSEVVRVTELGRDAGVAFESASALPSGRLVGSGPLPDANGIGGYADVRVYSGADINNETLVTFVNRSTPGYVKVCKIAGTGITAGTNYSFTVEGVVMTGPGLFGTVTRNITVVAGPASSGGLCTFVPNEANTGFQGFVIGTPVIVTETAPTTAGTTTGGTNQVRTSRITSSTGEFSDVFSPNPDLTPVPGVRISRAAITARREVIVFTFTNYTFRPVTLKICKIGSGNILGQSFNFTITERDDSNNGFPVPARSSMISVTAGPNDNNQGGNCKIVNNFPGGINGNSTYDITEGPGGTFVSASCGTCNSPGSVTQATRNLRVTGGASGFRSDVTINIVTFTNAPGAIGSRPNFDFDGDGLSDVSVFRPSTGMWYIQRSGDSGVTSTQFGASTDKLVAADFDGDGKTDIAVFRPSNGMWYIQGSSAGFYGTQFGASTDIPMPGDYDGDGKADIAVFRPSTGIWYIQGSSAGFYGTQFGAPTDIPVVGYYDGDDKADIAVFRPSTGIWYIQGSTAGFYGIQFGQAGDRLVPADYDGDGKTDVAVYRGEGNWYIQGSADGFRSVQFGSSTDIPAPADYNGDHKADITVIRNGMWYILPSDGVFRSVQFGNPDDTPVPGR